MSAGVTIRPASVARWGNRADVAADDLTKVPTLLADAVGALEESGGAAALAGSWALTAVLAAAAAASDDVKQRMSSSASGLTATAGTYASTDVTLAREINVTVPGDGSSWL